MQHASSTSLRHFVEQSLWNAFGVGLACVAAVVLLVLMLSMTPVCGLGMPFTPIVLTGSIAPHEKTDLRVEVSRGGVAFIGSRAVQNREIEQALWEALDRRSCKRIVIEADRQVSYGALLPIFRTAQNRGLPVVFVGRPVSVLEQSEAEARFKATAK